MTVWTLTTGAAGSLLLCLAALMLLARQTERPSRSWLWLIGLVVATESLPGLMQGHRVVPSWVWPALLLTILVVSIAWIAVDARPALGLAIYLVLYVVGRLGDAVPLSNSDYLAPHVLTLAEVMWPEYAILLAVGGLALWRLRRRQSVH